MKISRFPNQMPLFGKCLQCLQWRLHNPLSFGKNCSKSPFGSLKLQNAISPKNLKMYPKTRTENAYFYGFFRGFYGFLRGQHLRDQNLRDHQYIYGAKKVYLRVLRFIYGVVVSVVDRNQLKIKKNIKNHQKLIKVIGNHLSSPLAPRHPSTQYLHSQ